MGSHVHRSGSPQLDAHFATVTGHSILRAMQPGAGRAGLLLSSLRTAEKLRERPERLEIISITQLLEIHEDEQVVLGKCVELLDLPLNLND